MQHLINKWQSQRNDSKLLGKLSKSLGNLPRLHDHADDIHNQVFKEMDCLQCANCCKSIPPMVSNRDVKRIAQFLNMDKADFQKQYTCVDNDGDQVMSQSPCYFLQSDNTCSIYEVRPAACRTYPHSGDHEFFKNLNHHKRNMKYCPALLEIVKRIVHI